METITARKVERSTMFGRDCLRIYSECKKEVLCVFIDQIASLIGANGVDSVNILLHSGIAIELLGINVSDIKGV